MSIGELLSVVGLAFGLTLAGMGMDGSVRAGAEPNVRTSTAGDAAADHAPADSSSVESAANPYEHLGMPANWATWRVAGDLFASVEQDGVMYRFGRMLVDTKLPVGYPAPTPPGAIELKRYPEVRRAEISGETDPREGSMAGFFPLFAHIQRNDIAMTAPVEMDYHGVSASGEAADGAASGADDDARWTMSFLYETADLGPTGVDENDPRVRIVDAPAVTVLAIGVRGWSGVNRLDRGLAALNEWLDAQDEWEVAGDPRTFGYNGPSTPRDLRWAEVQIPVRLKATAAPGGDDPHGEASQTAAE